MPFKLTKLKQRVKEIQEKNGYCLLHTRHYATIECRLFCCLTGEIKEQNRCHYIIENSSDRPVFKILDGPTGYESYSVEDLLNDSCRGWFSACAGTKGRWDRLDVNGQEILEIIT